MDQTDEASDNKRKLNLKFVSEVIGDDYKNWNRGEIVLISAQTGTGKNYFVENILMNQAEGMKFLYISNRTNLKREVKIRLLQKFNLEVPQEVTDLDSITTIDTITITSYHALQNSAIDEEYDRDKFDLDLYDYIICDEIHFIMTDSSFNTLNRFTYEKLITERHWQSIKIFMSATMEEIKDPIIKCANQGIGRKPTIHEYKTGIDYSYVKPKYFKSRDYTETLVNLIKNDVSDDKWLVFITDLKAGNSMLEALGSNNCSIIKSGTKSLELTSIINCCCFTKKVLICTKAMDNGINIKDDSVKNIVILAWDRISLIQMLGRKRIDINDAQEINLYLCTRAKGSFQALMRNYNFKQEQVDLLSEDINAFNKKYNNKLSQIYDDVIYKSSVTNEFKQNPIGIERLSRDRKFALRMIDHFEIDYVFAFIHVQLEWLGLAKTFSSLNLIENVVLDSEKQVLVQEIEKLIGTKILPEDQMMLKQLLSSEVFHVDRGLLQGTKGMQPKTFNKIMKNILGLPYEVFATRTSKVEGNRKIKYTYWTIVKTGN